MKITVRKLRDDEEPPWQILFLAEPSQRKIESYLGNSACFVALIEDQIVGVFVIKADDHDTYEVLNIAVSSPYQGQRIGARLIHEAKAEAKKLGAKRLRASAANSSLKQLGFYQRAGFRIVEVIANHFSATPEIVENGIVCRDLLLLTCEL